MSESEFQLSPDTVIGHAHLKVSDLERARWFYEGILGMNVTAELPGALFFSFGDYHHDLGVNTWSSAGGPSPAKDATGLFHVAIRVPNRKELARALKRLAEQQIPIQGASDHFVSEAIYLNDPDGNGIEIYVDRDPSSWEWQDGRVKMGVEPLDIQSLMAELEGDQDG